MKLFRKALFTSILAFFVTAPLWAAAPSGSTGTVGKKAADKYFEKKGAKSPLGASNEHFMAIHVGAFTEGVGYAWGSQDKASGIGKLTIGVTYRIGEWTNSMDLLFRGDFTSYELPEGKPLRLSLMSVLIFPDASSQFPLYFGLGAGAGVFFKQIGEESSISFDYQLFMGGRFFNVLDTIGFFLEAGLKNHIHLLSDGQFNGVFVALGTVFMF